MTCQCVMCACAKTLPACNLHAKSIHLRLLRESDLPMTRNWRNRPDTCHWFGDRQPVTSDQHRRWYGDYATRNNDFVFVILENTTDEPIGQIALYDIEEDRAQLGRFVIRSDKRGHGYGHQAVHLMLALAFESLNLRQVYLKTKIDNQVAFNLYHHCGFIVSRWGEDYIHMLKVRV